jgi:hypothetical protein
VAEVLLQAADEEQESLGGAPQVVLFEVSSPTVGGDERLDQGGQPIQVVLADLRPGGHRFLPLSTTSFLAVVSGVGVLVVDDRQEDEKRVDSGLAHDDGVVAQTFQKQFHIP